MNYTYYIVAPSSYVSGGPELLHQLAFKLRCMFKLSVYIYYFDAKQKNIENPMPEQYSKYIDWYWVTEVEDISENVLIIPETCVNTLMEFNYAKIYLWWLSVDNFLHLYNVGAQYFFQKGGNWKKILKKVLHIFPFNNFENKFLFKENIAKNLYQSEYAKQFLLSRSVKNIEHLGDYINEEVISKQDIEKENIIIYNPKKGLQIANFLMDSFPNLKWVPIENMTPSEVSLLMKRGKIYVDFGHHPGKDRIPREAVLNNCILITNTEGAANFYEDIPIDQDFKLSNPQKDKKVFFELVNYIFDNYSSVNSKFDNYRKKILNEEVEFNNDIKSIFQLH